MRRTEDLLEDLGRQQVKLWLDADDLRVSAPKDVLTASLRAELADHKSRILEILSQAVPHAATAEMFPRVARDRPIPLSCGQERLWSLGQLDPLSSTYNISSAHRIMGRLDTDALIRSLRAVQRRHESLRTGIATEGSPRQLISDIAAVAVPLTDLSRLPADEREARARTWLASEIGQPFDLSQPPLWRCRILRLGREEHLLSVVMHHLIFDGTSKEMFFREVSQTYQELTRGQPAGAAARRPRKEPPLQYAEFAVAERRWLQGETAAQQMTFWQRQLAGEVEALQLPTDHTRPSAPRARAAAQPLTLPDHLPHRIGILARLENASMYMTLLAAVTALIHRYTNQDDVVLCSPFARRDHPRLTGAIGYVNNLLALRTSLAGNPTCRDLLRRVRHVVLEATANQRLPFQNVAALPNLVRTPLTRGMFAYRNVSGRDFELPGLAVSPVDVRKREAHFDLALSVEERDGRLTGVVEYNRELFEAETIAQFARHFEVILEAMVDDPDQRLDQLPRFGGGTDQVETVLRRHPKLDDAIVITPAAERLPRTVAYVVLNEHDVPALHEIEEYLESQLPDYLVPGALVPLDVMPLTTDGAIDRGALPAPPAARARSSPYVAPRTQLEQQLVEIWRRVLWYNQPIGIHDNFRDLGGHSLLAVQLITEIERLLGQRLPVRALARVGTIAGLVDALERDDPVPVFRSGDPGLSRQRGDLRPEIYHGLHAHVATWMGHRISDDALLVGLNIAGSRQPLFWCLQRYGELTQLAKYLGSDQPVYGMRSGNRVMEKTTENVKALANYYVEEIRRIRPDGPYLIGGNCQAAEIAFQVAKGMQQRGQLITLLCLLERFVPEPYAGRVAMFFGKDSDRHPKLFYREPELGWRKYYSGHTTAEWIPGQHAQFFREPNVQVLTQRVTAAIDDATAARGSEERDPPPPDLQLLPDSAYRAELSAPRWLDVRPGEQVSIPVDVTNRSNVTWGAYSLSGIALGNRWVVKRHRRLRWKTWGSEPPRRRGSVPWEDRGVASVDGRAPLPTEVAPGSTIQLKLRVRAPADVNATTLELELDLVEEGVTWFRHMGSRPLRVKLREPGTRGVWERVRARASGRAIR